jgi:hypothetical protein
MNGHIQAFYGGLPWVCDLSVSEGYQRSRQVRLRAFYDGLWLISA